MRVISLVCATNESAQRHGCRPRMRLRVARVTMLEGVQHTADAQLEYCRLAAECDAYLLEPRLRMR